MLERRGDLWILEADARCITTNGVTRASDDGPAVMGRGAAAEARKRYPGLDIRLGHLLQDHGNHVHMLMQEAKVPMGSGAWYLLSFPTKHHWRDRSDLDLIKRSCGELIALADQYPEWQTILL